MPGFLCRLHLTALASAQVKFQFYSVSEPTQANWDAGPLGQPGTKADWGDLDGVHGSFSDAPQLTAVWDDILCWFPHAEAAAYGEALKHKLT